MRQPIQPIVLDSQGVKRFHANAIVRYLIDECSKHGVDMNALAAMQFSREDRVQFAQLIGYSLGGFSELGYVTDQDYSAARAMFDTGVDERDARILALEDTLSCARRGMVDGLAALYSKHPVDFLVDDQ